MEVKIVHVCIFIPLYFSLILQFDMQRKKKFMFSY